MSLVLEHTFVCSTFFSIVLDSLQKCNFVWWNLRHRLSQTPLYIEHELCLAFFVFWEQHMIPHLYYSEDQYSLCHMSGQASWWWKGLSLWHGHAKALPLPYWIPDKGPFFSVFPCVYPNKVTATTYLMSLNVSCRRQFQQKNRVLWNLHNHRST